MTIGTGAARADYLCNGVTVAFPVPFPFFGLDELLVVERIDATGVELTLTRGSQYTVTGGNGVGGTVTATAAPLAGRRWSIIRATARNQGVDYVPNDPFPAESHERALDRLMAVAQEQDAAQARFLRVPVTDAATGLEIPSSVIRANKVLAFDAAGAPVALSSLDGSLDTVQPVGASAARSLADHLDFVADPRNFGGVGDGIADDTAAIQAAFDRAAAVGGQVVIWRGTWRTTDTVRLGTAAGGLVMHGRIRYDGPHDRAALEIGAAGGPRISQRIYRGLSVQAAVQSDWLDERSIGVVLHNLDGCHAEVQLVSGFTIGVRTQGSGVSGAAAGFEDTNIHLGRLQNNRFGLDIHCSQPGPNAWNNSVRYFGGHWSISSACNPTITRYGVRLSRVAGAYALHNAHFFFGPAFELQNGYQTGGPATPIDGIPFLNLTAGRAVIARAIRMEACSRWVAEHRNAGLNNDVPARIDAQDCIYEVAYAANGNLPLDAGTGLPLGDSYLVDVKYGVGCNRAGGTVIRLAQAAAGTRCTRLLASVENMRAAAFRQTQVAGATTEVGVDAMAVLSSNVAATTLAGLAFAVLSNIVTSGDGLNFPTSRALGWVVRVDRCKEFEIAFDGNRCRPFVMIFDAAENVIQPTIIADPDGTRTAATTIPPLPPGINDPDPDPNRPDVDPTPELPPDGEIATIENVPDPAGPVVLWSNAGTLYNPTAKWWTPGVEPQDFTLSRIQRMTLPDAAKLAIIGISSMGREGAAEDDDLDGVVDELHVLRSARLYCPPEFAPAVVFGGARAWGSRELAATATWDPSNLPAGTLTADAVDGGNVSVGTATPSTAANKKSITITVVGASQGDLCEAGWAPAAGFHNGGFLLHAAVGGLGPGDGGTASSAGGLVTVTAHNLAGGSINQGSGTVFVRVTKPRL